MPFLSEDTVADRSLGTATNMHPRENGDMILTPTDLFEGSGDFINVDGVSGNPEGWTLGQPEKPDGRHVYIGLSPGDTSRQTHRSLAYDRPSHLVNYTLLRSQPPPNQSTPLLAKIPTPPAPILKAVAATSSGYPGTTLLSPYFYAWAYVIGGRLTPIGPPTSFQLATGQSAQVLLPTDTPEGITELALLMSEPGTSRPSAPGPMRVQRIIDLKQYFLPHYDLTGHYRYNGEEAPKVNNTMLPTPGMPVIGNILGSYACKRGKFKACITWTDANGETLPGPVTPEIEIVRDNYYSVRDPRTGQVTYDVGRGKFTVRRPTPPAGATGWRCYVYITPTTPNAGYQAEWSRVYNRQTQQGDATPLPLSTTYIYTSGFTGGEQYYAGNDVYIIKPSNLPTSNTTGIKPPTTKPEPPTIFGAARPDPATYFVRVTDVVKGVESLPSDPTSLALGADQLLSIAFARPENIYPNSTFIETTPDNLPAHWTITQTGGVARMVNRELLLETLTSQTGATPTAAPNPVTINPTNKAYIEGNFTIEPPKTGTLAGTVEVVFRQTDAFGTPVETIIKQVTAPGEYTYRSEAAPASQIVQQNTNNPPENAPSGTFEGLGTSIQLRSTTTKVQVLYRITGATKHMRVSIRETITQALGHFLRPQAPPPPLPPVLTPGTKPAPAPATPLPVNSTPPADVKVPLPIVWEAPPRTVIQDPPEPSWTPDAIEIDYPDRPIGTGLSEGIETFETGIPAGWTTVLTGSATLAATAAAAINGTQGLQATKSAGGTNSTAHLTRAYAPPTGRTSRVHQGIYQRNRLAVLPAGGSIGLHSIEHPTDATKKIAWLEASSAAEVAELVIEENALKAGSVTVTLDKVSTNVSVVGVQEVTDLNITGPTTGPGTVQVDLDGQPNFITAGGLAQIDVLRVDSIPAVDGLVTINVNGQSRTLYVTKYTGSYRTGVRTNAQTVYTPNTTTNIAYQIAAMGWTGYKVSVSNNYVTFTADLPGTRPASSYSPGATGMSALMSVKQAGANETAAQLAARIREKVYPGYTTAQGASASIVRFTAVAGGPRVDLVYNAGTTGAPATVTTVTQGSVDSAADLAARIRATVFANWTTSGTGTTIRFTANTGGVRQAATYGSSDTGATGTMRTVSQGSNGDIIAYAQDSQGQLRAKKIIQALSNTTIFNTDITVSGADTKRGIVHVWGSIGSAALQLLARFDGLDLTGWQAGRARIGVTSESAASLTWTLHTDEVDPTDRGRTYFRDHNAKGQWVNQAFGYYAPTQPVRQDLFLQDGKAAVLPGQQYTLAAWIRATNTNTAVPVRPLVAVAHEADTAKLHPLGDITNTSGLVGSTPWTHYSLTFTVPDNCFLVSLNSRDISSGQIVLQEGVLSPGNTADRSYRYATSGTYLSTFDIRTPQGRAPFLFWGRERTVLGALTESRATGTSITTQYRSAPPGSADDTAPGDFSAYQTDPELVPQDTFLQTLFTATGPGTDTPIIRSGSPYSEVMLKLSSTKRMSTLLSADRTELPGGVAFAKLQEWSYRTPHGRRRLPSGRLQDEPLVFGEVGHLPECEILVFNDEARTHIERFWKEEYTAELFGREVATLRLSEPPEFYRVSETVIETQDGRRHGVWRAKLAPSEVIRTTRIPQ